MRLVRIKRQYLQLLRRQVKGPGNVVIVRGSIAGTLFVVEGEVAWT